MTTILEGFADALQGQLQNFFCSDLSPNLDRLMTLAVNIPNLVTSNPAMAGLLTPPSCPTPPRFPTPLPGGQCGPPALYRVCFQITNPATGFVRDACIDEVGPVSYITEYWQTDFFGNRSIGAEVGFPSAPASLPNPAGIRRFIPTAPGAVDPAYVGRVALTSITRLDGPDDCGSLPRPVLPPSQQLGPFNISFPFQIGPDSVTFTGNVIFSPAIFAPVLGGVLIPVQVNLNANATLSLPVSFPVYLSFPGLRVVTNISFNPSLNPEFITNIGGGGGGGGGCDCDDIRRIVIEELDEKFPPSRPFTTEQVGYAPAQSRVINLPQFATRIRIQLVNVPVNAKEQSGVDAPDVVYAGWYSFGWDGGAGERQPIHYRDQWAEVPADCNTFSYTCYTGFTASLTVVYLSEQ